MGPGPPFPNDGAYKASIRNYRETILVRYQAIGADQGSPADLRVWFESHEAFLMDHGGLDAATGAVPTMLGLLEGDASMIADLGSAELLAREKRPAAARLSGQLGTELRRTPFVWPVAGTAARIDRRLLNALPFQQMDLPMNASGQTVCLNMIVKNEAPVISRCIDSVRPIIDCWTIVDTGSSDGTQDIIRKELSDLPGELHERPWRDFASNRSEALELARGRSDYISNHRRRRHAGD